MQYFKRIISKCKQLSEANNYPLVYFLADMIQARLFCDCKLDEYIQGKVYKMKLFERKEYVSFKRGVKLMKMFNQPEEAMILNDKVRFLKTFDKLVKRDWIDCRSATEDDILAFVKKHGQVIIKPIDGMQGKGVKLLDFSSTTTEEISALSGKKYLMEEYIRQHEAMTFGSKSLNTVRVYTIVDKNGKPMIIKAIQRAGVGNVLVDNFHQGGIIYPIDIETGIIEERGMKLDFHDQYLFHPGTDICMIGYQIPNWEKVKELALKAAVVLPNTRYAGWDIAVLKDRVELIEGNQKADFKLVTHIGKSVRYHDLLKMC